MPGVVAYNSYGPQAYPAPAPVRRPLTDAEFRDQQYADSQAERTQHRADIQSALTQLGNAPGPTMMTAPVYGAGGPEQDALDASARTASKEQRGLQLQGGLKALASRMNSRGLGGSGSESAGIARLVGMSKLGGEDTERSILNAHAAAQTHANDLNFSAQTQAASQNASAANTSAGQRLQALLSLYGMSY